MNHPHPDELLLFASGELTDPRMADVVAHLGACGACRDALRQLDESLTALGGAWPHRARLLRRPALWGGVALAAAATLAVVLIRQPGDPGAGHGWIPTARWSATAGYVAGGKAMLDIDAQLTRLEQESYYGRP
jgi:hypothetical protein